MAEHPKSKHVYTVKTLKDVLTEAKAWEISMDDFHGICKCIEEHLNGRESLENVKEKVKPMFKKLDKGWRKVAVPAEYVNTKSNLCNATYLLKYKQRQLVALSDLGYKTCSSPVFTSDTTTQDKSTLDIAGNQESVSKVAEVIEKLTKELEMAKRRTVLLEEEKRESSTTLQTLLEQCTKMEDSLSRGRKGKKTKVKPNEDDITPAPADKLSIYIMESFKRCTDNIEALKHDCKVKELETACLTGHALELRDKVAPVSYMIGTFNSQWPEVTNASKKKKKGKGKAKKPAPKDYTEMSASDVIQCTSQALTEIENIFPKLHELMECKKEIRDMESWISASADSVQSGIAIEPEPGSCSTNGDSLLKIPPNIRIQMEKFFNAYLEQRNEVSGLKEDIQRLQQERKQIDDKGQTIEQDHERLEAEMLSKEEDIGKLTEKVSCRDKKIEDLKHQNDMLLRRQEQGKEALSQLKQNIKDAEASTQERQNLQQNINQLNEEIAKKEEIVQHVIQEKESFRAEMSSRDVEIRMLKKDMSSRSKEIDDLKNQNDNLLNRISKQAEARLTDGNHAITDLSDPNRPTSLAEKFSELYDNEWTEAFEEVTDNKQKTTEMKDNEAIAFLLDILCVTNDYCRTQADAQWREMLDAVCQKSTDDVPQIPAIFIKDLRNVRKMTGNISAESVVKRFVTSELSRLNTNPEKIGGSNLNLYIQKCVELCWLMSTQNPPLFLYRDVKLNDHLDQDYFKFYTCGGTTVDFLVWPALLCKENGDLLRKGVCQGLKRK